VAELPDGSPAVANQARTYQLTRRNGFLPSVDQLASLVSPQTRVLLINSPSNPAGALVDAARMREIVDFADQHDLWIISDECYDGITFDDTFISPATMNPARVISVYSFSKTYARIGWRIGYLTVPEVIGDALSKCQEALVACVSEPTQWAALATLTRPQGQVRFMRGTYRSRCAAALDALRDPPLLPVTPPAAPSTFGWTFRRPGCRTTTSRCPCLRSTACPWRRVRLALAHRRQGRHSRRCTAHREVR
jgi:aspartate aminotransferase